MPVMTPAEEVLLSDLHTLAPLLRRCTPQELARRTVCTEWSVLDIVAHVGSALGYVALGKSYDPSPEANAAEVNARRDWPADRILDEYEAGLRDAGPAIVADDRLAGAALGTWVHGGDIRAALGLSDAYASAGSDAAIVLLQRNGRVTTTPLVQAVLPHRTVSLGTPVPGRPEATLKCDVSTLFRLYTGRPATVEEYVLTGAERDELVSQQW